MTNSDFLEALKLAKEHPAELSIYGIRLLAEFIDNALEREEEKKINNPLIEFTSAEKWDDPVFVDPGEVSVITPLHKDRDLASYTRLIMKNGSVIEVSGSVERIAECIRAELLK